MIIPFDITELLFELSDMIIFRAIMIQDFLTFFRGSVLGSWCVALSGNSFSLHSNIFLIVNNPPIYKALRSATIPALYTFQTVSQLSPLVLWKYSLSFCMPFFSCFFDTKISCL